MAGNIAVLLRIMILFQLKVPRYWKVLVVGRMTVNFGKKVANYPVWFFFEIASQTSAAATRNPKATLAATRELFQLATTAEGKKVVQKCRSLDFGL